MHVLGVREAGADHDTLEAVVDRIVDRLSERGRVGVVRYDATIADGTHARESLTFDEDITTVGGDVTYDLGVDGDWTASGTGMSVGDALDSLATDCDYAVVIGVPTLQYPSVVVGSSSAADETDDKTIATVDGPGDLEFEDLVAALESAEPHETLESLVTRLKRSPRADRAGAIATFTGRVRAKDSADDARTQYLEFEKYVGVADERMAALETDLEARDGVFDVELYHRTGIVEDGDDIVFVVVLAGHREEAFRTVEDGINRLKDEVPLFKKEVTVEDEFWVHERS
ncbi:molybdopterin synthase subunit MoaE /molybdopterin guanine dinucleotide biosynthesis accessory protein MobB [Natrinema hispanicum]|uniref:Molybdopterin synthase subunit MoaE /molybdopterin guanine dinucleotide biosynthesis accessory protein MobB n=1 Tax=Natrinema hispanicum TaxID=392421 RepID=A0A482YB00_9EURY|nr:molybdopterin synthase [Natrinema hispanicum]RZV11616.1 molybdopterin synthase subunit MoaE /molybdopterin guanine dinucleotide biosynthesis accessory protein MobB [Natrinema hispanicum]